MLCLILTWTSRPRRLFGGSSAAPCGSTFAFHSSVFGKLPLPWRELLRRTWVEIRADNVPGLAAQLSYYWFLALFPAILFVVALASFFPLTNYLDDLSGALGPFVSPQVLELIQDQMRRI